MKRDIPQTSHWVVLSTQRRVVALQQNHFLLPPCLCLRTGNAGMKESLRNSAGSKLVAAEGRGQGQWRGTAHGYRVSFWGAGNVLDLEVVVAQH